MHWKSQVFRIPQHTLVYSLAFTGILTLNFTAVMADSSQVTMESINDWGAGFQGQTTIRNTGTNEIDGWSLSFDANFEIQQLWNARIVSHDGNNNVLEGIDYNSEIPSGGEARFGFTASPGGTTMPTQFTINGTDANTGTDTEPTPEPDPTPTTEPDPEPTTEPDPTPTTEPDPDPTPDPTPTTEPDPTPTTEPDPDPTTEPDPTPTTEPDPDPTPEPDTDPTPAVGACGDDPTYGPRELKLLTRQEYQNSIEDLVGIDFNVSGSIPYDTLIEGYYNNAFTAVSESHADAYFSVAKKVAAWSAERNFQGVVDCGFDGNTSISYEECQSLFLNEFGTRVFRRPLTSEEQTAFQAVFDESLTGGDIKVGIELGLSALLSSPRFLYRSEAGTPVQGLNSGSSGDTTNDATVNGSDFQTKSTGGADGSGWNIWSNGYIEQEFTLANDVLFQISMKGDAADGVWPEMKLIIDGTVVATATVDSSDYRDYEFSFIGYEGSRQVQIRFTNDYNQDGSDRNLYVQSATVSGIQSGSNIGATSDLSTLDSDAYVLSDYEMASFLSYTLTGSTPDDTLLAAAQNGELSTDEQVQQQTTRLLETNRAKQHMGEFAAQWLGSDEVATAQKNSDLFPDFTPEVGEAMAAEVKAFFTYVFYDQSQGFSDLFSADYVFVNNALANYYGLGSAGTDSSDPEDFVKVDSTSANRGGLMTMGAFLANEADLTKSSPIKRAANVRLRMLCQDIPQPDDTIPDLRLEKMEELLAELDGKEITTREFIAEITKDDPCSFCHDEIINPLGFTFEDYDASGRHITVDHNGLSIDSTGTLYGVDSLNDGQTVDFTGGKDLSNKFAELGAVRACFSANVFRYAMDIGHDTIDVNNDRAGELTTEEKSDYGCSVDTLSETLTSSNSMSDLFTRLGTLDVVRYRKQRDR
jgi:hypothetical protein